MKILIVGGGGREHALAWKLSTSRRVDEVVCAPGNPGIAEVARCEAVQTDDIEGMVALAAKEKPHLVVVGPEAPLVAGLADRLRKIDIPVFGPSARAAMLEGSKGFSKDFMARYGIPTARYRRFEAHQTTEAKAYLETFDGPPYVLKADGLAAGKGVIIAESKAEAEAEIDALLGGRFGKASASIVIEEFMAGEEASFFALCDGDTAIPLAGAQDHKRVGDGDTGPNTGGMGAYSPAPILDAAMQTRVMDEIVLPTIRGMKQDGRPFQGVLFVGLMIDKQNGPRVVEYNVRFGDPECEAIMVRLRDDLLPQLFACAVGGELAGAQRLQRFAEPSVTVIVAAKGYPGEPKKGGAIRNLAEAARTPSVQIFHAGTAMKDGQLVANGGRVLAVTATGATVAEAQQRAYAAVDKIDWPDGFCRRDIAWRALT